MNAVYVRSSTIDAGHIFFDVGTSLNSVQSTFDYVRSTINYNKHKYICIGGKLKECNSDSRDWWILPRTCEKECNKLLYVYLIY